MTEFILKTAIALVIFYAFYHAFLAKESMFRFNRFFLIFALCFSLTVPFLPMPFGNHIKENLFSEPTVALTKSEKETSQTTVPAQPLEVEQEAIAAPPSDQAVSALNWNAIFLGTYFLGLLFFTSRFIYQMAQLMRLTRNNPTIRENDCTYVLLPHKTLPFTFLHFLFVEKKSFLSQSIEKEILFHELAHIRQKHSWDILLVEFLKVVFWFNPLYYLFKRAIQLNHEFLADEAVNATFREKTAYQWLLLNKTSGRQVSLSMSSPFNVSSTKQRIMMMGKFTSSLKTNLLKSISLVLVGCLTVFLSSSRQIESTQFQTAGDFEQLLSEGFKDGDPFELDLNKLDLHALRSAYLALDEEEKFRGTEFPFFEEQVFEKMLELQQAYPEVKTSIHYERSPEKKEIKKEVFEQWKKTKNISLTIDDIEREVSDLNTYQTEDFAMFTVRETEKSAFLKRAAYHVSLMTHEYFHGKYYKSQKKIELIQGEYPSAHKVQVFYRLKNIVEKDGKTSKIVPQNYEASIFHHLRTIDPTQIKLGTYHNIVTDIQKSIPIAIQNENRAVTVMRIPTI